MMIRSVLLTSIGLASIVQARIYAGTGEGIIECPWDANWNDFDMLAHMARGKIDWTELHFDQASGSMEALVLPEYFWLNLLTPAQTIEIILNPKLRPMLLKNRKFWREIEKEQRGTKTRSKLFGRSRARKLIERKLDHFRSHLKDVDPIMAGEQAEQVMEAIPPETYKHTSPLLATMSRGFKVTKKNVAKLFGFTLKGLRAALPYLVPVVLTVLKLIATALITGALSMGGLGMMGGIIGMGSLFGTNSKSAASTTIRSEGPFYVAQLLLHLLEQHPILDRYIGDRVRLLVAELQRVMDFLQRKMHRTNQKIGQFNKRYQLEAKRNVRRGQISSPISATRHRSNQDRHDDGDSLELPTEASNRPSSLRGRRSSTETHAKKSLFKLKGGKESRSGRVCRG